MSAPGRTLVMGIVNVTPDSFSDGGLWHSEEAAIAHGLDLVASGADIVDIGGESTRPGAERVSAEEELRRVVPVVQALVEAGITVSVDTMRAEVARSAVEVGAAIINDVSGGLADPLMAATAADLDVDYVAMHWRAHSTTMDHLDSYTDAAAEVTRELSERIDALVSAGVKPERIILDPGLGFAKVGDSNWDVLGGLESLQALGHRVLIGGSRKRFLGATISSAGNADDSPLAREHATTALTALSAWHGVWAVRVHDARAACDAIAIADAWQQARKPSK